MKEGIIANEQCFKIENSLLDFVQEHFLNVCNATIFMINAALSEATHKTPNYLIMSHAKE